MLKKNLTPVRAGLLVALGLLTAEGASAASSYGSLSNFDVYNDSIDAGHPGGITYYGFEIELEGIDKSQIWQNGGQPYTFNSPHFGAGQVSTVGSITYIDYFKGTAGDPASQYAIQPWNGAITATGGHACVSIGGCEHFGTVLSAAPTAVRYHWLDSNRQADTSNPINLLTPIQTVVQPPAPAQPAVVKAVVVAPPPPPQPVVYEFGDATWVKVYKTEANKDNEARLEDLMADKPDKIADASDGPAEVEWRLLQHNNFKPDDPKSVIDSGEKAVAADTEQVLRTYIYYKFAGQYDPETHEAICNDGIVGNCEDLANAGLAGPDIGRIIGQQMIALDLNPANLGAPVPLPGAVWLLGSAAAALGTCRRRRA